MPSCGWLVYSKIALRDNILQYVGIFCLLKARMDFSVFRHYIANIARRIIYAVKGFEERAIVDVWT